MTLTPNSPSWSEERKRRERLRIRVCRRSAVDLAGFSAITNIFGDASAISVLKRFEELMREALDGHRAADQVNRRQSNVRIALTRTGINHGPVIRRSNDVFGSTVNIAARIAAIATPGQLLATQPVANVAVESRIATRVTGMVALRSIGGHVQLHSIEQVHCRRKSGNQ